MVDHPLAIWLPFLSQLCALISMILLMAAATSFCRSLSQASRALPGRTDEDGTESAPAAPV